MLKLTDVPGRCPCVNTLRSGFRIEPVSVPIKTEPVDVLADVLRDIAGRRALCPVYFDGPKPMPGGARLSTVCYVPRSLRVSVST